MRWRLNLIRETETETERGSKFKATKEPEQNYI